MKTYEKLQTYLSNLAVLNVKLHNIHWNVEGEQFMAIHEFTEEIYEDLFVKYDEIAEILKMKGEIPLVKLEDYAKNATIKEEKSKEFKAEESLEIVKKDLREMKRLATEIREEADEEGEFEIVAELEEHVSFYSQNIWFIEATLA